MAEQGGVVLSGIVQPGDVLARNNQKVHRRLRVEVLEGDGVLVFVDDL